MAAWRELKLRDLVVLNYGKPLVAQNRTGGSIPVYSSAGVTGHHNAPLVEGPGVIVPRKGTIGQVYYSSRPFWPIDTVFYILPNEDKYDLSYVYYLFQTLGLDNLNDGSVVPSLNREVLYQRGFRLPPLAEQKAIAGVLKSLDDKLDFINRQNADLEATAEAIYSYLFLDSLGQPNLTPVNWGLKPIKEVAHTYLGGTPSRDKPEYWGGPVPWINSRKVNDIRIVRPSDWLTDLGLKRSAAKLLPEKTIVLALTGSTIGQISVLEIETSANQSVLGIVPRKIPYEYLYCALKFNIEYLVSRQTGGAQQHLTKSQVDNFKILAPDEPSLAEFQRLVAEIFQKISRNRFQAQDIQDIRSTVLPRLISGDLQIS
ncbi:MAG: restriction endonuclease subunit S [Deltaproteobacteria bacterium]|jgi:type I restriction enzyme S subunit|nr:restriction endonuclease subunit S [Deltaproteobacteria bacterium]